MVESTWLLNTKATIWVRELTIKTLCFLLNISSLRSISRWKCIKNHVLRSNLNRSILKVICWTLFKYFGQLPGPAIAVLDNCVNQTWYYFETLEARSLKPPFFKDIQEAKPCHPSSVTYLWGHLLGIRLWCLEKNIKNKTDPPKWQKKFDGDLPAVKNHTKHKSKFIRVITLFITSWWFQPTWKNMSQICRNLPPPWKKK